jgi:hypothetical protein
MATNVLTIGMTQCAHPDCQAETVAKGLCGRHYMRLRRHGDTEKVKKKGRPSGRRAAVLGAFEGSGVSQRSLDRNIHAIKLLHTHGINHEPFIKNATRPNGSMNMLRLEEMAEFAVIEKLSAASAPWPSDIDAGRETGGDARAGAEASGEVNGVTPKREKQLD